MTLTIAPADEACLALVDQINTGTDYVLTVEANYSRTEIDRLEEIDGLRVDVVAMTEKQPAELLDNTDPSSHEIQICIRKKIQNKSADVPDMALLARQIFLRVNNWDSSDRRVRVWDCDVDDKENPDKSLLNEASLYVSSINLRVEVNR